MLEFIFRAIGWFFMEIIIELILGGISRFFQRIGLRIYSIFTGEWGLPMKELTEKHGDKIVPWLFGAMVFLVSTYFLLGSLLTSLVSSEPAETPTH